MRTSTLPSTLRGSSLSFIAAFGAIYIIWGSTYLAIKIAITTIPPMIMAGSRFMVAALVLFLFARWKGEPMPTLSQWRNSLLIGTLLLVCGNGGVVFAEQWVPSGITALLVTIEPIWVVLILFYSHPKKPDLPIIMGLLLGMAGIYILVGPSGTTTSVPILGLLLVVGSTFAWAVGSVYASRADIPSSPFMATALQMFCGSVGMLTISVGVGEWQSFSLGAISWPSYLAWGYLIVFGSLVGYTAYAWLTQVATPSQVSTYAYVNPVVAVLIGVLLGNEEMNWQIWVATPVLVIAVVLLLWKKKG